MPVYFTANTVTELLCLLCAIIFLYNDESRYWKLFITYLFLTCLTEIAGIHIRKVWHQPNYAVYNVFTLVEGFITSYFFFYLYSIYVHPGRWLKIWLSLFVIVYVSELYINHFGGFVFKTTTVMSVVFVLACLFYYYLMLKDERFRNLWNDAPFWWVNGTLFFYFGSITCNLFFEYLIQDTTNSLRSSARYVIFIILNIILYSCWSYSFLCRYRQRTSSSLSN